MQENAADGGMEDGWVCYAMLCGFGVGCWCADFLTFFTFVGIGPAKGWMDGVRGDAVVLVLALGISAS